MILWKAEFLQGPANERYPDRKTPSSHHHILLLQFILILFFHLILFTCISQIRTNLENKYMC
jgi:ABC-type uncharacterized transport system permease subunit